MPENLSIQLPNTNIRDHQSCSACQSTLLLFLFLKRYGEEMFQYFPCELPLNKDGVYISGCPPVASAIIIGITDSAK